MLNATIQNSVFNLPTLVLNIQFSYLNKQQLDKMDILYNTIHIKIIISYTTMFSSSTRVNHAVLVVGWGTQNNIPYWLIKNSWGTTFGDKGYIKIKRRK